MSTMVIASGLGPLVYGMTQQWFGSYQPVLWLSLLLPMFLMFGSFWADNPQRTRADCLASR
jgi:cyanate permease